jgi:hypothetical protein
MSLPYSSRCSDCSNGQTSSSNTSTLSHQPDYAAWDLAGAMDMPLQSVQPVLQDPFAYNKAFLNTDPPSSGFINGLTQDNDGYTCHTGIIGAQDLHSVGRQQQVRARAIPCHNAVGFTSRFNEAPLATIIEQGSYSTLNSPGSLLGVGRFHSLRMAEKSSPDRALNRISCSRDENTLQRIQEDAPQELDVPAVIETHARPQDCGRSQPIVDMLTPMKLFKTELPRSPKSQISDADHGVDNRRPKRSFRGVLHHVRAASRARSRSSSLTHTSFVEAREERPETSDNSPLSPWQAHSRLKREKHSRNYKAANFVQLPSSSVVSTPTPDYQARSRKMPLPDHQPSALASTSTYSPLRKASLPLFEQFSTFGAVPQFLSSSAVMRSLEQSSSVRLVSPEPRDVAYAHVTTRSSMPLTQDSNNASAQNTFDGASVPKYSSSMLTGHDRMRDASLNTSFCSTMSTSYSGTVLGVDLDLQHATPQLVRHSSSPMSV